MGCRREKREEVESGRDESNQADQGWWAGSIRSGRRPGCHLNHLNLKLRQASTGKRISGKATWRYTALGKSVLD